MSGTRLSPFAQASGTVSPQVADSAIALGRVRRSPFAEREPAPTEFIPSVHADDPEDLPNGMAPVDDLASLTEEELDALTQPETPAPKRGPRR
jgi:hypothetical protein